jgi:hypothetical protein
VKHVYVETNFIIDLLRPLPSQGATDLYAEHGKNLTLHVPWCALTEARRKLEEIIREDLSFVDNAGRFLRRLRAESGQSMPQCIRRSFGSSNTDALHGETRYSTSWTD